MRPKTFWAIAGLSLVALFIYFVNPRLLLGAAMLIAGAALVYHNSRELRKLAVYEFNNRTNGDVVNFSDYDYYMTHKRSKFGYFMMIMLGLFIGVLGFVGFLAQFK